MGARLTRPIAVMCEGPWTWWRPASCGAIPSPADRRTAPSSRTLLLVDRPAGSGLRRRPEREGLRRKAG